MNAYLPGAGMGQSVWGALEMSVGAAALFWAELGMPVFPCIPMGKKPIGALVPHGVKNATTDPATIRAWWLRCPTANVGLATGSVFALAADGPEGRGSLITLQRRHGPLPPTVATLTGSGGWHVFYRVPPRRTIGNSAGRLGPKLDVRGAGPSTTRPDSADRGRWVPISASPRRNTSPARPTT